MMQECGSVPLHGIAHGVLALRLEEDRHAGKQNAARCSDMERITEGKEEGAHRKDVLVIPDHGRTDWQRRFCMQRSRSKTQAR